jgi:hypothetical protein
MDANFSQGRAADPRACRRVREQLCEPATGPAAVADRHTAQTAQEAQTTQTAQTAQTASGAGISTGGVAAGVAGHLASCPDCAAFARRLELVRQALGGPLATSDGGEIEPDPQFAARVLARVARPAELIGWAAFRTLPAALGLALALAGLGWLGLPGAAAAPPSPLLDEPPSSDQLLTWSSLPPEVGP